LKATFKNIGIIIQARMGSTRLPSKIMLPVKGDAIFQVQIDRLKKINYPLYIATTIKEADNAIVEFAKKNNIPCYRGDEANVLSRYYECAKQYQLDLIIRITSDCPLIDASVIDEGIKQYLSSGNKNLYLSNAIERTYPRGFDFEIFSFELLQEAYNKAEDMMDKEHVTPFIWKNKSGHVNFTHFKRNTDESRFRLTLDTKEDLELLKILIEKYGADKLSGEEIIQLMHTHPELALINQHIEQKKS
jgi:spore coat polysaccharide biosynthesis protein SpsF